jgi:hypothetical protein
LKSQSQFAAIFFGQHSKPTISWQHISKSNFENHPAISAEYVKFLATNSGSEKVEKLESQLSVVTEKLGKAVDESKRVVAKSDAASTKCSELVRDLALLTKKVKALEDRK